VVSSGQTDTHTVGPIGTSKAAELTQITAVEGLYKGVRGHDGVSALAKAVGPSVVRVKNQSHNESTVQPTDGIRALLVVWSMCIYEKKELKKCKPTQNPRVVRATRC